MRRLMLTRWDRAFATAVKNAFAMAPFRSGNVLRRFFVFSPPPSQWMI
jgi:hypothetical protein